MIMKFITPMNIIPIVLSTWYKMIVVTVIAENRSEVRIINYQ